MANITMKELLEAGVHFGYTRHLASTSNGATGVGAGGGQDCAYGTHGRGAECLSGGLAISCSLDWRRQR